MPEPTTLPAPPDLVANDEQTVGWVQPPTPASPPDDAATVTRTVASTPGPGDADRHTLPSQTQLITPGDLGSPTCLPDIPGYYVEKVVGRGGMGVVYRAIDLKLNRVVALKVMHPGGRDHQHAQGRFEREVQALATIDHPNIVRIYGAAYWHGFPYFAMQYVSGGTLSHHAARFRGDPVASARLVAKVGRAVQALHDRQIIHRDLKPLNILLDGDEPLVADFGLAKWLDDDPDSGYTATGYPVGTRQYMAPEQTEGKRSEYSGACDVWAMGVVLYELLAGRRPFPDDGNSDVLKRIREDEAPALPESVPAALAAVVRKCLAKTPGDRYATAEALAHDLESWLAGDRVSAAHPPRRRWRAAALLGLLAVVAVPAAVMVFNARDGVKLPSVSERVRAGETVYLTDAKGKPLRPITVLPLQPVGIGADDDGDHHFISNGVGMARLLDEPLPLPVRIEAEITIPPASDGRIHDGGIFFGEKTWHGGGVVHYSALRVVIAQEKTENPGAQQLVSFLSVHRRYEKRNVGGAPFETLYDRQAGKPGDDKLRVVPVSVILRTDEIYVTIDGQAFKTRTWDAIRNRLRNEVIGDPLLGNYPFAPPVLGDGIGITLNNANLIVRNLRLTKLDP